ncbi:MAG: hypothetical protein KBC96_00065 [Armatimonadetes bacterium]|nr:hypothetical protein [Armatimonadota bacterium]
MKRFDSMPGGIFSGCGLTLLCALFVITVAAQPLFAAEAEPPIVGKCKADLAKRLELKAQDINAIETTPITWPDASLGIPEPGKMYAQVLTPGYRIILEARGVHYLYTASEKTFKYGNQKASWYCSVLYLKLKPNDANLNGDLYQCSVTGTNRTLVASEVSDYYPQDKGAVLFTRRTSRSGFDLFYVKTNDESKPVLLQSAFAFGDAAVSADGKQWAAFIRSGVASGWKVAVGNTGKTGTGKQDLFLPEGIKPEQIAWSDANVMILAKKDDRPICFEISLVVEKPEWKQVAYHLFHKVPDLMLSKSHSILVEQAEENGKPFVKIGTVWFTGDETVNARIENFTMRGMQFPMANVYVFVWGEKDGKPAAYTVDYERGTIIALPKTVGSNFKPFNFPAFDNPIFREK